MADKPINQAPEQSDAMYSVYVRKNNTTNDLTQVPANQFAHAVGLTAANRGRFFRVNSSGDVESAAAGTTLQMLGWDSNGDLVAKAVPTDPLLHVRDEKSSGTAGGATSATTWHTRTLNTVKTNEITGASLSSDQITLPAGTYFIHARAPAYNSGAIKSRLYNVTDAAVVSELFGASVTSATANASSPDATLFGRFTLASSKALRLEMFATSAQATNGLGFPSTSSATTEVYSEVMIWKVA